MRPSTARIAGAGLLLLVWSGISRLVGASIIFPGPLETGASLWVEISSVDFYVHLSSTLVRALSGFALAFAAGVAWGFVTGSKRPVAALLDPALILIRATPVIAVILLALIWFRSSLAPIFVTLLMVLPVVVENVSAGVRSASGELREMAQLFRVGRRRRVRELLLPALRPYLFASAHSGMGMAFKVTVAAEVLVQPPWALGGAMQEARFYLDTPRIMALTLSVIGISALAETALRLLERAGSGGRRHSPGRRAATGAIAYAGFPVKSPASRERLAARRITHGFGGDPVLLDLSFELDPGVVTVVLGPSGCGKTTLLRIVAGLVVPDSGSVHGAGVVSMAFQEPRLLPWATAVENICFVRAEDRGRSFAEQHLAAVRLARSADALPGALSGGMQQRLALARAFACAGDTLLLDEPFQNLDLHVKLDLAQRVREVTATFGTSTLMVTHDVVEALATADRILILTREPASVVGDRNVDLRETERDPRSSEHQRRAAELYDLLLCAR